MAHERVLVCGFDEESRITYMKKSSPYGVVAGVAFVDEEDTDIANRWDGIRIAEMKCDIAIQQKRAEAARQRAKGIEHAYNVLNDGTCNETLLSLKRQVNIAQTVAKEESKKYKRMKDSKRAYIENMLAMRRKLRERKPIEF